MTRWLTSSWLDLLIAWSVVGMLVGAIIGFRRDRLLPGILLGGLLGPVGWLIVALVKRAQVECPGCSRLVSTAAHVCPKCGVNLRKETSRSSRNQLRRAGERSPW